jgi:hypothetical protein
VGRVGSLFCGRASYNYCRGLYSECIQTTRICTQYFNTVLFCRLFTKEQISRLEKLSVYDIILSVTELNYDDIQTNPFAAASDANGCKYCSIQCYYKYCGSNFKFIYFMHLLILCLQ